MFKLKILLIIYSVKKHLETKTKQRLYSLSMSHQIAVGFTLAEVLITLLIIGIVASLVIPALVNDTQDTEYKTAYKKAFADVSQALLRAENNYELVDINESLDNVVTNIRTLEHYFSVAKTCTNAVDQGCWTDNCTSGEHDCFWTGSSNSDQGISEGFIDNTGRYWILYKDYGYFIMMVDTNGAKKPNRMGRDRFPLFFVDENNKEYQKAPIKINPYRDEIDIHATHCKFGNCFYTSWLKQ